MLLDSPPSLSARVSVAGRLPVLALLTVYLLTAIPGCSDPDPGTEPTNSATQSAQPIKAPLPPSAIRFEDIAQQSGVRFTPQNGRESGFFTILESLGTGVAICDFDRDSQPDIILPGGGGFNDEALPIGRPAGVFRQQSVLQFTNVSAASGIDTAAAYTHGIATADWNNDGFDDVVITGYRSVQLFQNMGDGSFADVTSETGIRQDTWATSAAFLDADLDGCLELYVVNYVEWVPDKDRVCIMQGHRDICPPGDFNAQSDCLYHSDGDGHFSEISARSGLLQGGKGLAVIAGDVDIDGDTDIYVANDTTANFLYLNDGSGVFDERGLSSGCALGASTEAEGSMGVDFADFNEDGYPDLWVSNYENQSFAMYQSCGPAIFQHVSTITGIAAVGQLYVGFGTVAFEADLDGDEDIFAANGHVMYRSDTAPVRQPPLIYENTGDSMFRNVAASTGPYGQSNHMGRGVAAGDLDQDGLIDLVVSHINEPIAILHNTSRKAGQLLTLQLVGRNSNRSAIGATATLKDGKMPRLRKSAGSYLSESFGQLYWGVNTTKSDVSVDIHWPSGRSQSSIIQTGRLNTVIELEEP